MRKYVTGTKYVATILRYAPSESTWCLAVITYPHYVHSLLPLEQFRPGQGIFVQAKPQGSRDFATSFIRVLGLFGLVSWVPPPRCQ